MSSSLDRRTSESKWLSRVSTASPGRRHPRRASPSSEERMRRRGAGAHARATLLSRGARSTRTSSEIGAQDLELANGFTTALLEHSSTEVLYECSSARAPDFVSSNRKGEGVGLGNGEEGASLQSRSRAPAARSRRGRAQLGSTRPSALQGRTGGARLEHTGRSTLNVRRTLAHS